MSDIQQHREEKSAPSARAEAGGLPSVSRRRPVVVAAVFLGVCIVGLGLMHLISAWIADQVSPEAIVRHDIPTYRLRFRFFSLDREMTLPAWFSSLLMTVNGGLLLVLAWVRHRKHQGNVWA